MPPLAYNEKAVGPSSSSALSFFSALPSAPPVNRVHEDDELPAYAARASVKSGGTRRQRTERVEHVFHLRGSVRPWLKLVVRSRASKPEQMPYLLGGEPVTGYVELSLEKPEWFTSVEVTVSSRSVYSERTGQTKSNGSHRLLVKPSQTSIPLRNAIHGHS